MFQQHMYHGSTTAADLIASAHGALDRDLDLAQLYLDRLADLLSRATEPASDVATLSGAPVRGGLASWQVRVVVRHIADHLSRHIGVDELAALAKLSTGHFCRAFKTSTASTPHNFITRKRVERAQSLMLTTRDTLTQIASASGMADQAHLTRLFRHHVGVTPMLWRRTWQEAA